MSATARAEPTRFRSFQDTFALPRVRECRSSRGKGSGDPAEAREQQAATAAAWDDPGCCRSSGEVGGPWVGLVPPAASWEVWTG